MANNILTKQQHNMQGNDLHIVLLFLSPYSKINNALPNYFGMEKQGEFVNTCTPIVHHAFRQAGKLDAVFVIATNTVQEQIAGYTQTHLEKFKADCGEFTEQFIDVAYNEKNFAEQENFNVVCTAAEKINAFIRSRTDKPQECRIKLCLDMTGGLRHTALVSISLAHLLRYEYPLLSTDLPYSMMKFNCSEKKDKTENARCEDCNRHGRCEQHTELVDISSAQNIFDIISGTDEFVRLGSVNTLNKIFNKDQSGKISQELKTLLDKMRDFSDALNICNTSKILKIVADKELKQALDNFCQTKARAETDVSEKLFGQLTDNIDKQYEKLWETPHPEIEIIRWCLEKDKIQQAMTFFVEWMPKYIVGFKVLYPTRYGESEYFKFTGDASESIGKSSWQYYLLMNDTGPALPEIDESYIREAFKYYKDQVKNPKLSQPIYERTIANIRPYYEALADYCKNNQECSASVNQSQNIKEFMNRVVTKTQNCNKLLKNQKVSLKMLLATLIKLSKESPIWGIIAEVMDKSEENVTSLDKGDRNAYREQYSCNDPIKRYRTFIEYGILATDTNEIDGFPITSGYHELRQKRNDINHANAKQTSDVSVSTIKTEINAWLDQLMQYAKNRKEQDN